MDVVRPFLSYVMAMYGGRGDLHGKKCTTIRLILLQKINRCVIFSNNVY